MRSAMQFLLTLIFSQLINAQFMGQTSSSGQQAFMGHQPTAMSSAQFGSNNFQQNPNIPCGLPPFVDKLPSMAQQQLRGVWMAYRDGENCGLQQAKTFEIIRGLTETERSSIFGQQQSIAQRTPSNQIAATPELIPMFIRTSSPEVRRQFDEIWANEKLDLSERYNQMETLANKVLNAQQLTDFKKWIATIRAQKSQLDARINALPPEARNALQQIESLRAKERQIIQSLNPLVANQLIGIL